MSDLVAPSEQWLSARVDPAWALSDAERNEADRIETTHGTTLRSAEIGLAAAFGLYVLYAKRQWVKHLFRRPPNRQQVSYVQRMIWQSFLPTWMRIVVPHLVTGYLKGVEEAGAGKIPEGQLLSLAQGYARGMGQEIHNTSTDAVMLGFQAQINRKVPSQKAVRQVAEAYGVPERAMNTLVTIWNSEDPKALTSVPLDSIKDERIKHLIKTQLHNRGKLIGENETWAAKTTAKQVVWMYGVQNGLIPKNATRTWITAKDEKVCPVCGPMHGVSVKVNQKFDTEAGKFWAPPTHPRCRCEISLDFATESSFDDEVKALLDAESVAKSFGDDPYTRDKHGRFAEREGRSGKPVKERYADPTLQRLIREAQTKYEMPDVKRLIEVAETKHKIASDKIEGSKIGEQVKIESGKLKKIEGKISAQKIQGKISAAPAKVSSNNKIEPKKIERKKISAQKIENALPKLTDAHAMSKIPNSMKHDIQTNSGYWQQLDRPLYGISDATGWESGTLYVDETHPLTDQEGITSMVASHWMEVHQDLMDAYWDGVDPVSGGMPIDLANHTVIVTDEDYSNAIDACIAGRSYEVLWLYAGPDEDNHEFSVPIPADELAQVIQMGNGLSLAENIKAETPTVFVMIHGRPESTDIPGSFKYGVAHNPGKWNVVGEYTMRSDPDEGGMQYGVINVEPID